ncbi:EamA family transporter [Blastochloris viridis]|uniref:Carboxylate/amino acid/amine transporter n=1 Tax=Blastochloris viridis TaxID=1079 RepID=A0A0H5BIS2_BLAVI|nr:EamA family transporter [Blastochloris viridis]ALK09073.1 EamA-like transporter family protein [Blastochloris viridis]BAS01065.1 hypothetical protein BV133_3471 [Blastochloris viridis]CUU41735.1 carboxylate/amino acid/amine transporter [Blastochloris viridis]
MKSLLTPSLLESWQVWALLSAVFAAATAILAKVGVVAIEPDTATFIRTVVVLFALGGLLAATGHWQAPTTIPAAGWLALVLSGLATGASWLCYFRALKLGDAARVAPLDKLSVVLVAVFGAILLGERLSWTNWLGVGLIALGAVMVAWKG